MMMRSWVLVLVFVAGLFAQVAHAESADTHEAEFQVALLELLNERLGHMKAVAQNKRRKMVPTEDKEREAQLLSRLSTDAQQLGLAPAPVQQYFQAQMEAAKNVQRGWRSVWRNEVEPMPSGEPDLSLIRSVITKNSERQLQLIAAHLSGGGSMNAVDENAFVNGIDVRFLGHQDAATIYAALLALTLPPP